MKDSDKQRIEPEAFTPFGASKQSSKRTAPDETATDLSAKASRGLPSPQLIVPLILVLIAIAIVFIPLGSQDDSDPVIDPSLVTEFENQAAEETPAESPWADSQLLKARRETQEILAELLSVQKRLEQALIETWDSQGYTKIQELAEKGDLEYKERNFDTSFESYSQALDLALRLDASVPEVANNYKLEGFAALEKNDISKALEALNMANQLMPGDTDTQNALRRAEVRESVLTQIDQSNLLAKNSDNLEKARELLESAQTLDPDYPPLDNLIASIDQDILERDFRANMSKGFSALNNGQFGQATQSFNAAIKLKPNDAAANEALIQVEAAKLNNSRQIALSRAQDLEVEENWQEALNIYNRLLSEDASLSAASLGKLRSEARYKLEMEINKIIADPLALQSDSKWRAANNTLADALGIIDAGPKLKKQAETLQEIVKVARTPVVLKLESDNLTDVEIYRVGKLGTFKEQAMNLNPGKYVIVGRRSGYQDVRVDLAIDGSKPEVQLAIACMESI